MLLLLRSLLLPLVIFGVPNKWFILKLIGIFNNDGKQSHNVTSSHTVFLRYTLATNKTDRSWFEVMTSWRRAERKLGRAKSTVRFCSACLQVELDRRSADRVCLW